MWGILCLPVCVRPCVSAWGRGGAGWAGFTSVVHVHASVSSHNEVSSRFSEMCDTSSIHRQTDCYVRCEMMVWGVCMHRCSERLDNFKPMVVRLDLKPVSVFILFWMWLIMQISVCYVRLFCSIFLNGKTSAQARGDFKDYKSIFVPSCIFRFSFSCSNLIFFLDDSWFMGFHWFVICMWPCKEMAGFWGSIG